MSRARSAESSRVVGDGTGRRARLEQWDEAGAGSPEAARVDEGSRNTNTTYDVPGPSLHTTEFLLFSQRHNFPVDHNIVAVRQSLRDRGIPSVEVLVVAQP
jgi:hypothetical protein